MDIISKRQGIVSWIIFIACISFPYLLLAPKLGFYVDDWERVGAIFGFSSSKAIHDLCSFDRPNLFYIYNTLGRLIGASPLAWHVFLYFSLLVAGYLIYRIIKFTKYFDSSTSLAIAGIIILYPCNIMYYAAVTYSFLFVFPLILFSASLLLTIANYKNKQIQIAALVLSGILTFLHEIQIEYLVGLELARFILVYALFKIRDKDDKQFVNIKSLKKSLYLNITNYLATVIYLIWRFFIFHTTRKEINQNQIIKDIISHPVKAVIERFPKMISDLFDGLFGSYFNVFSEDFFLVRYKPGFMSLCFLLVCIILIIIMQRKSKETNSETNPPSTNKKFYFYITGLFLLAAIISLLPSWFIDKHITLNNANSRFGSSLVIPGTLIFVFLLSILFKRSVLKYSLWIYLSLCSAFFYRTFLIKATNWENQKLFYSQILWRFPNLPVGTSFIANTPGEQSPVLERVESAPINFIYGHSDNPKKMNYWIYDWGSIYHKTDSLAIKGYFTSDVYNQKFKATKEKEIPITYEVDKCLKFGNNNGPFKNGLTSDFKSLLMSNLLMSNIGDKTGNAGKWPTAIMGKQMSSNCYCYYFQRAEFFNSSKNYKATDSLFNKLLSKKDKIELPKDLLEWMPFIKSSLIIKGLDNTLILFKGILLNDDLQTINNMKDLIITK